MAGAALATTTAGTDHARPAATTRRLTRPPVGRSALGPTVVRSSVVATATSLERTQNTSTERTVADEAAVTTQATTPNGVYQAGSPNSAYPGLMTSSMRASRRSNGRN